MSTTKQKFEKAKAKVIQLFEERPLETIATFSAAALATAKLISSISEARNTATWKREVQRRERKQQAQQYTPYRR
jgi:hypothetical protein